MAEIRSTFPSTWVQIIGGKHKGKTVKFVKRTAQRVAVEMEDGKIIYLLPDVIKNIVKSEGHPIGPYQYHTTKEANDVSPINNFSIHSCTPKSPALISDSSESSTTTWVQIIGGKHKGKTVRFVKRTAQRVAVEMEDGKIIYLLPDVIKNVESENFGEVPCFDKTDDEDHSEKIVYLPPNVIKNMESDNFGEVPCFDTTDNEDISDFVSAVETLGEDECDVTYYEEEEKYGEEEKEFVSTLGSLIPSSPIFIQQGSHSGKKATFVKHTAKRIGVTLEGETKIRYLSPSCLSPVMSKVDVKDENDPMVQEIQQQLPNHTFIQNVTDENLKRTLFGVIFALDNPIFFHVNIASVLKLPKTFIRQGQSFRLTASKLHDKAKSLTCIYLPAPSNELIANKLLSIGSFDKLIPRKTGARLELLLSTAAQYNHIHQMDASQFCSITEQGNVGCGFIPHHMIDFLLGTPSPEVCALQVRIVIPSMGIFKGVLFEKAGIDKIELPSSMQKVKASIQSDRNNHVAWLMITKTGIFPYTARVKQAENSFQDKQMFPNMARWMLQQKGVSRTYLQQPNGKHSNLLGVADPTDAIPSGCVFLSGIHDKLDNFGDKIVISRFPMTEASDGRVLSIVREKPNRMLEAQWKFLCSKPFGIVVFGNSAPGDRPIPETIAQGDLDGDGYFVTWDPTIVQDAVIGDKPIFPSKNPPRLLPANWWSESQEFMANLDEKKQGQKLIGRLHDCWLRNLRNNLQQDAILFGRAYKEALVLAKHGGKVSLPARLCSQFPRDLHSFIIKKK